MPEEDEGLPMKPSKYQVQELIAKGGMGAVYRAEDASLERTVALKVVLNDKRASRDSLARFTQEAKVLARLEHPNIVPIHELGIDDQGEAFYTMKFVKGCTLHHILSEIKAGKGGTIDRYPLSQLITIFQKVCDAVSFAHSKGVVHRDLKPENIMIGDFGEVLVMDWGLAKILESNVSSPAVVLETKHSDRGGQDEVEQRREPGAIHTLEGRIMGTPNFMAPEQAEGRVAEIDQRTDIYALGGILYNLLTLRPPISSSTGSLADMLGRINRGEIRPPTDFNDFATRADGDASSTAGIASAEKGVPHCPDRKVPPALSAVAMKALSVRNLDRYAYVEDLQKDVAAYQGGFATAAEATSVVRQLTLLVRRNKMPFSVAAAALLLLLAVVGGFTFKVTRTLAELRGTAPTFYKLAQSLMDEQKFDEALQKIDYGLTLTPAGTEFHYLKGRILQALLRLEQAQSEFAQALRRDPNHAAANENYALCEKLLKENLGRIELLPGSLRELHHLMIRQGRSAEAVAMMARIGQGKQFMLETWKALLERAGIKVEGRLKLNDQDQLELDLNGIPISDLSPLKGMPLSKLEVGYNDRKLKDLGPLKGMPLTHLNILNTDVSDLRPLQGMPLEWLDAHSTLVSDLSPLKNMRFKYLRLQDCSDLLDIGPLEGMQIDHLNLIDTKILDFSPLRRAQLTSLALDSTAIENLAVLSELALRGLSLSHTRITDLSPLRSLLLDGLDVSSTLVSDLGALAGMPLISLQMDNTHVKNITMLRGKPLRFLYMSNTRVSDISVLRNMPLIELRLDGCKNLKDITPLMDCRDLQRLTLPLQCDDLEFLRSFTNLQFLSYFGDEFGRRPVPTNQTPAEFWKTYDARKKKEKVE